MSTNLITFRTLIYKISLFSILKISGNKYKGGNSFCGLLIEVVNSLIILSILSLLIPIISLLSFISSNICPPFLFLKEQTVSYTSLVDAFLDS